LNKVPKGKFNSSGKVTIDPNQEVSQNARKLNLKLKLKLKFKLKLKAKR